MYSEIADDLLNLQKNLMVGDKVRHPHNLQKK